MFTKQRHNDHEIKTPPENNIYVNETEIHTQSLSINSY